MEKTFLIKIDERITNTIKENLTKTLDNLITTGHARSYQVHENTKKHTRRPPK